MKEFLDIPRDERFTSMVPSKTPRLPVIALVILLGLLGTLYYAAIAGMVPEDTLDQAFGLPSP